MFLLYPVLIALVSIISFWIAPQQAAYIFLMTLAAILAPSFVSFAHKIWIKREKQKLLQVKLAAQQHLEAKERKQQQLLATTLAAAVNGDLNIMPRQLPRELWRAIDLLRCVVAENYLALQTEKCTLGEDSLDWHVALLKCMKQALADEQIDPFPLTQAQTIKVMESHLNHLENIDECKAA